MSETKQKALAKRLSRWDAQEDYGSIVEAVLALPPEKREDWLLLRLAAAYNSLKEPEKAAEILESIRPRQELHWDWQYQLGRSLLQRHTARGCRDDADITEVRRGLGEARQAIINALRLAPGPEEEQLCRDLLARETTLRKTLELLDSRDRAGTPSARDHEEKEGRFGGLLLLDRPRWDIIRFKEDLYRRWGMVVENAHVSDTGNVLLFTMDGCFIAVCLVPAPVPGREAEEAAAGNYLWPEAPEEVARHQAHLMVAVMGKMLPLPERGKLFVKVMDACCGQPGAIGVCQQGTVFQPSYYQSAARMIQEGMLPVFNWIWFGLRLREEGLCACTYGMDVFGKDEIEVLDTAADPAVLRGFLSDIASCLLERDLVLSDGDVIDYEEKGRLPVTRSPGVFLSGMTLKVPYWETVTPSPETPEQPSPAEETRPEGQNHNAGTEE